MLADVQQGIGAVGVAQPEVERQVAVRRQVGIVVDRCRIELIAARRLDADEGQAIAQAGDHHPPVAEHRVLLRLAPARQHRLAIALRQACEAGQVVVQRQALGAGP